MYLCMSLSNMVIRDHPCGGMIPYAGEWHEEALGIMRNQIERVAITDL